jgi:hypothetical protein
MRLMQAVLAAAATAVCFTTVDAADPHSVLSAMASCTAAKNCKKGIYVTFQQFATNSPGISATDFTVARTSLEAIAWTGKVNKVDVTCPDGLTRRIPRGVWGFNTGGAVFVAHRRGFFRLSIKKHYASFGSERTVVASTSRVLGQSTLAAVEKRQTDYILDMASGQSSELTPKTVRGIIADDAQLLQQFDTDPDKRSSGLQYVRKYYKQKDRLPEGGE